MALPPQQPDPDIWAQAPPIQSAPLDALRGYTPMPAAAPAPAAKMAAPVDPGQQQILADQAALQKVRMDKARPWGFAGAAPSPEFPEGLAPNHNTKLGKIGHAFATLGNIAGDIFAPSTMALIPGTQLNRQVQEGGLAKRLNTEIGDESLNQQRGAETAKATEETKEAPGKAASEEALQGAQASLVPSEIRKNEAEVTGLENPWMKLPGNEPVGNVEPLNKGMADRYQVLHPGAQLPPEFQLPPNATKNDFDRVDKLLTASENASGNQANRAQSNAIREAMLRIAEQNANSKNLWSVAQPDGTSKIVSLKPGDTIPKGAVNLSGQSSENVKAGTADRSANAAIKFANDYIKSGQYTGPSDEALQDQFFEMAKPSSGFRMNQAQIDQLHHMTDWINSAKGIAFHAATGTWFAPQQRVQIVDTMNALGRSKGLEIPGAGGGQEQYTEGQTATGPGGHKIKFSKGQWVPQ